MALEIPDEDAGSITAIQQLRPSALDKLIGALKSSTPISDPMELGKRIAQQVPDLSVDDIVTVLRTLNYLYNVRELSGVGSSRFLDDLMDTIKSSARFKVAGSNLPKLRSVLQKLMSIETLHLVAKAARLQRDGERIYCLGKILSDIRPVFGSNPVARPAGAVLTHTLRIGYHDGDGHKEFYVVLDSEDLVALGEVVERAKAKGKALGELLKDAKLPNLAE